MNIVTAQLGLLEDELAYRLAMLTVNVLQPLKDAYPNIVVTSGLRQPNTGIGQHELGEAVDIQIRNQTDALICEVADFINKRLPFDQLILNFSESGDPWIHVSFSTTSNRRQVMTKDYADEFHDGLFLVSPLTGEEAAEARRQQQAEDAAILAELRSTQQRQAKLTPRPAVIQDEAPDPTTANSSGTMVTTSAQGLALVTCVQNALAIPYGGVGADFEVTKRIAWLLQGQGAGLYIVPRGQSIIMVGDNYVSSNKICFPDGKLVQVMTMGQPTYADAGTGDPGKYLPAIEPGDDFGTDWLTCSV